MSVNPVEHELAADTRLLETVERGGPPAFRTWTVSQQTVVVGRSVVVEEEVEETFCEERGIAIVRRQSGGRSVLIGPGTVQYAFALPYAMSEELATISGSKHFCNRMLVTALTRATAAANMIEEDASGDLVVAGRKVAGLALRRRHRAMLLHGTILVAADLEIIAAALRHPKQEPAYRAGRPHGVFLANVGALDELVLREAVIEQLASLSGLAPRSTQG